MDALSLASYRVLHYFADLGIQSGVGREVSWAYLNTLEVD